VIILFFSLIGFARVLGFSLLFGLLFCGKTFFFFFEHIPLISVNSFYDRNVEISKKPVKKKAIAVATPKYLY